MQSGNTHVADMLRAIRQFLKENDMMAYVTMMAIRLIELHRVLKSTGSIYLHCDPTAGDYLRILMDAIFGADNFKNEVVWKRTSSANNPRRWRPVHDLMFFYSKSKDYAWNCTARGFWDTRLNPMPRRRVVEVGSHGTLLA
jgi:adenine specific DNA methylase Mod